jgi:hypothetical protein
MQSRLEPVFTIKIPIHNEFDRGIVRRKISKLESMSDGIFVQIKKALEKDKEFVIEYDNQKYIPLRSIIKEKQAGLHRSKLSRLPYIFK